MVIAIIALLISLVMPVLQNVKENARRTQCATNLKHIGLGYYIYANDNDGWTPANLTNHPYELYILYSSQRRNWYNDGILYRDGYVTTGRVFYCPSNAVQTNGDSGYEMNWWLIHDDPASVMGWPNGEFFSRANYTPWFSRPNRGGVRHALMDDVGTANTALNCDNLNWPLSVGHNGGVSNFRDSEAAYNVLYGDGGVSFWKDRLHRITWFEMLSFTQVERVYGYLDNER